MRGNISQADEKAYEAMLTAAKTLVQVQWLDVPNDPAVIVEEFRKRFVEPKMFWDTYHHGQFANYLLARHEGAGFAVHEGYGAQTGGRGESVH